MNIERVKHIVITAMQIIIFIATAAFTLAGAIALPPIYAALVLGTEGFLFTMLLALIAKEAATAKRD